MLPILDVFDYPDGFAIVMPLFERGSLISVMKKRGHFSRDKVKIIVYQILKALGCLHAQSIIHRDVKLGNILMDTLDPLRIRLADFGCASLFKISADSFVGTHAYSAPEVYAAKHDGAYDAKVDVYSTGMVLLVLLGIKLPSDTPQTQESWNATIGKSIASRLAKSNDSDLRKAFGTARRMGAFDAKDRPTLSECFHLPWLADHAQPQRSLEMPGVTNTAAQGNGALPSPPQIRAASSEESTFVLRPPKRKRDMGNDSNEPLAKKAARRAEQMALQAMVPLPALAPAPSPARARVPVRNGAKRRKATRKTTRKTRFQTRNRPQAASTISSLGDASYAPGDSQHAR